MYMYYKPFERVPHNGEDFHHKVVGIKHKISRSRFIRSNKKGVKNNET